MQRVAMIGLGTMGAGMAANWLAKGFEVAVYNRTRAKAEPLAAKGARVGFSDGTATVTDKPFTEARRALRESGSTAESVELPGAR